MWDISPPVHAGAPVFPGDTPYRQRWAASIGPGCPVNVSEITLSPHVGAHADAPLHYDADGASIGHTDLAPFLGRNFFPMVDTGQILIHARVPVGTRVEETAARFAAIQQAIRRVIPSDEIAALDAAAEIRHFSRP